VPSEALDVPTDAQWDQKLVLRTIGWKLKQYSQQAIRSLQDPKSASSELDVPKTEHQSLSVS
jgi:hypothetical protein